MVHALHQLMLQGMAVWPMADVMQDDGRGGCQSFFLGDGMTFDDQIVQGLGHQMRGPQCMMESMMMSPGIHQAGQTQLRYAAQALEIRVLDDIEDELIGYGNKAIDRIVQDFALIHDGYVQRGVRLLLTKGRAFGIGALTDK